MNKYIVLKERILDSKIYICLTKGDIIEVFHEYNENNDWPNWMLCKKDDIKGWVPAQIIQDKGSNSLVKEDYNAFELNLMTNDILISEKSLNGWIFGYKESNPNIKGWAPLSNLSKIV